MAITSLDANGDPNGFGAIKTCTGGNGSKNNGSWGHPSTAQGNKQFACYVLRKDPADARLQASSNVNQEIGGVFYTFSGLGVTAGQPLYGYALLGPDGTALNGQAQLQWQISNGADATVALQRSSDGISFQTIYSPATGSSFTDMTLPPGTSHYRLVITVSDGRASYSQTLTLHQNNIDVGWKVYPTIVEKGQTITLDGLTDGYYTVSFYDAAGSCRSTTASAFSGQMRITLPAGSMPSGIYWLNLYSAGKKLPGNGKIFVR